MGKPLGLLIVPIDWWLNRSGGFLTLLTLPSVDVSPLPWSGTDDDSDPDKDDL